MKSLLASIILILLTSAANAESPDDQDITPVPICGQMPKSAIISVLNDSDVQRICRAMGLLDGVRVKDIRNFSKAVIVIRHEGYEDSNDETAKQLVQIIRLRGLYDKPDRWEKNLDIIVRVYQAFNGVVTPIDTIQFLKAAGDAGKMFSDEGFKNMLIVVFEQKKQSK